MMNDFKKGRIEKYLQEKSGNQNIEPLKLKPVKIIKLNIHIAMPK